MDVLDSLGEDLVLLSVSPGGKVTTAHQIGFGLMGSELARLAAAGKITIAAGRVDVTDQSPAWIPSWTRRWPAWTVPGAGSGPRRGLATPGAG